LKDIPGAEIKVNAMDTEVSLGDPIQIQLSGPEHDVLRELASDVVDEISRVDGVYNPESSAGDGTPQLDIVIDKDKAATYGLTQDQILGQIQLQFTGQVISQYREEGREMDISMVYPEDERSTISDLQDMKVQTPTGSTLALEEVADLKEMQGPVALSRQNQQPQLNVTSEVMDRDLGSVMNDIEDTLASMDLPEGYAYDFGAQAEDMEESFTELTVAIIFSLPATVIGVLLGLFVMGIPFSIPGFIGIIMLAGIVVNNSIVLVDYINILRRRGMERYEAIIEAGRSRLRPILMTTLTTILAM